MTNFFGFNHIDRKKNILCSSGLDDAAAISPPIKQYCVHYRGPILKV